MNSFRLITTYSPWLILACLAVGALYAWLLYTRRAPWSATINYSLAAVRFLVVSFLCFLLLGPMVRYLANQTIKPAIVFALDNSESVRLFSDSVQLTSAEQGLQAMLARLQDAGYTTEIRTLTDTANIEAIEQLSYSEPTTNLSQLLQTIRNDYNNQNLAGVVLLSDGIVNQGTSPTYATYNYNIYPVAVGDTIPKKDIVLASLRHNNVTYSGNRFPLEAEIEQQGFDGETITVVLKENGKQVDRKSVTLKAGQVVQQVPFQVMAGGLGKRHFEVEVEPKSGEFTTVNNIRHAYIDVVKGRIKILVAAAAPHPDLHALRAAIETNENYETELYIPGLNNLKVQDYDVAILHQLPGRAPGGDQALSLVRQKSIPTLFILGPQSDISQFNSLRTGVRVNTTGQADEVTTAFNPAFSTFKISENAPDRLNEYPPAIVPFGDYQLAPNTETVLYQQVGTVRTTKPLLALHTAGNRRQATLLASGTWQWRLHETANHQNPEVYDKLITNLMQLLSTPRNKKRLNVYPAQSDYTSNDEISFEAEVYNEALEPIYGQNVTLTVTDEAGESKTYTFANGENQSGVNIGNLPGGRYTYAASARVNGSLQQDRGEFIVEELQLEALHAVADHDLLYQLASQTGSGLYFPGSLQQLQKDILAANHKPLIDSHEDIRDIIDLKWLFFVLLLLVTLEWFVRKYNGSY